MLGELLLVKPTGTVDARQLRILLVPAPIGTRDARQLERRGIELARRSQMRPAAHVHPAVARAIDRQLFTLRQFGGPFGLERLAIGLPFGDELVALPDFAREGKIGGDDLAHLLLDQRQLLVAKRAMLGGRREVVIEAVVRRRAEGDLRAGKQLLHRLRQHMRIVVACEFERVGLVAAGDQREVGIAFERTHDVAKLAIDARRDRGLGEAGTDRRRDVGRGRTRGHFTHRAIGKADFQHLTHRNPSFIALVRAMAQGGAHRKRPRPAFENSGGRTPRHPNPGGSRRAFRPRPTAPGMRG